MAYQVIMPRQGQSVESCILGRWNKENGDRVLKGDLLFSYETDKAAFEFESPFEGILLKKFFVEGDEVPVLTLVAVIGEEGEEVEEVEVTSPGFKPGGREVEVTNPGFKPGVSEVEEVEEVEGVEGVEGVSPRARRRAEELGILLQGITGSGPGGRIIERDILKAWSDGGRITHATRQAIQAGEGHIPGRGTGPAGMILHRDIQQKEQAAQSESEVVKLTHVRKIIAARMQQSLQTGAQLTHHTSADARNLLEARKQAKANFEKGIGENITINDLVCFATIRALLKHPLANCHFLGDSIRIFKTVHLGIAVDTERGLMVPTVRNADRLSISQLSENLKAVAVQCKNGNIDPELLNSESATFSVSNLGSYGVEIFTPVINLPQVAILGVNTLINRPTDLGNGVFGFVPHIGLSLTYDHRALDGAPASALLRDIRIEIENLILNP